MNSYFQNPPPYNFEPPHFPFSIIIPTKSTTQKQTMAERPTPHSVAVCTLIALHSDPSSLIHDTVSTNQTQQSLDSQQEGIGEHLSKVIRHIVLHDNDAPSHPSASDANNQDMEDIDMNMNINSPLENMQLPILLNLISGPEKLYQNAAKILLEDLCQTFSSIDSLLDLFGAFRATVAKGVIDGDSAHGVYVRKRCLGFDQLGFDAVGRFWEACCDYINVDVDLDAGVGASASAGNYVEYSIPSCPSDELRNGDDSRSSTVDMDNSHHNDKMEDNANANANPPNIRTPSLSSWPLAPGQISRSLLQKCHDLDSNKDTINHHELESQLHCILQENPELTLAHYLRFMNCAQYGERVGALEHFHRYFDYAMIQERKERLAMPNLPESSNGAGTGAGAGGGNNANNANGNGSGNGNDARQSNKQKGNVVQYVTIVLASLFHKLGNNDMAHMATLEAIKVAQQSGDEACLAYALGWLHATSDSDDSDVADRNQGNLLDRASARGREHHLHSLVAGASLQRAGRSGNNPPQAWESVAGATASTTQAMNAIGNTIYLHDVSTSMVGGRDTFQVMAQQHMVGAGLWQAVGRQNLALATNQLSMHCYDDQMAVERLASIVSDVASSVLYGSGSDKLVYTAREEKSTGVAQPLCSTLDRLRTSSGKNKKQVVKDMNINLYTTALEKIRAAKRQNPKVFGVNCYHSAAQIILEASTRKSDIHSAQSYELFLHNYALASGRGDRKALVQAWGLSCLLLCQKGEWDAAKSMISNVIIPYCQKYDMHFFQCHFLLQLVMIYFETSPENPTCIIPTLLECLALSEEYSIDPIHASALSLLSRMHFEMDNVERAKAIMKAAMPVILQHSHVYFQGQAWLTLAKCTLSEVKDQEARREIGVDRIGRGNLFKRALLELHHAADLFEKLQDVVRLREVYYLTAQVCNSLCGCTVNEKFRTSNLNKRDASAQKFLHYNKVIVSSTRPCWHDALADIILR